MRPSGTCFTKAWVYDGDSRSLTAEVRMRPGPTALTVIPCLANSMALFCERPRDEKATCQDHGDDPGPCLGIHLKCGPATIRWCRGMNQNRCLPEVFQGLLHHALNALEIRGVNLHGRRARTNGSSQHPGCFIIEICHDDRAPAPRNVRTIASPIPDAPPVTIATWSSSRKGVPVPAPN